MCPRIDSGIVPQSARLQLILINPLMTIIVQINLFFEVLPMAKKQLVKYQQIFYADSILKHFLETM